jgi:hypothetical protein
MTKQELKKLIRETLSEVGMSDVTAHSNQADPRNLALPELNRWKAACQALSTKISAALIGKPMTGELVKGTQGKRSPIQTVVKSVDVELSYKTKPDSTSGGSGFYVHVYAMGEKGQAGMLSFGDYV